MRAQNRQFVLPTPSILGAPLFYELGCCPLTPLGLIFRVLFISSEFLGAVPLACCLRVRVLFGVFLGFYFFCSSSSCLVLEPALNTILFILASRGQVLCGAFLSLVCGGQLLAGFVWEGSSTFIFHFIFIFIFISIFIYFQILNFSIFKFFIYLF